MTKLFDVFYYWFCRFNIYEKMISRIIYEWPLFKQWIIKNLLLFSWFSIKSAKQFHILVSVNIFNCFSLQWSTHYRWFCTPSNNEFRLVSYPFLFINEIIRIGRPYNSRRYEYKEIKQIRQCIFPWHRLSPKSHHWMETQLSEITPIENTTYK